MGHVVVRAHIWQHMVEAARADLAAQPVAGMTGQVDSESCRPDLDDRGRRLARLDIHVTGDDEAVERAQNELTLRCSSWSPYGWCGTTRHAAKDYLGPVLANAVLVGNSIPAHDEMFDLAEQIAQKLHAFHAHVCQARDPRQANAALLELTEAITSGVYDMTRRP